MTNNVNTANTYSQFLQIPKLQTLPAEKTNNSPDPKNKPIAAVSLNQLEKEEKSNAFTKTVASIAIISGVVGLIIAKGASSKFYKNINSYMQTLDDKIYEYTQKHKSLNYVQKGYLNFNKGLRKVLDWLKSANNVTAMKDSAFKWFCSKTYLTKPMDWVTRQFKKLTILTSKHAYENARNITDNNIAHLREFIPLLSKTNPKEAEKLNTLLGKLEGQISSITNATTRNNRLKDIEKSTKDIGNKVGSELWQIAKNRSKRNLEKLRLYRTEVHAAPGKMNLTKDLQEAQRDFTFNIEDITKIMKDAKDELGQIIRAEDKESRSILRMLNKQIKKYSKLSGSNEANHRSSLTSEMLNNISKLENPQIMSKYSEETQQLFRLQLNEIKAALSNADNKGTIEQILSLLNTSGFRTANPQAYNKAKALTKEIRSATNNAFENELKLYDKFAEYSVGSAPTDVLGLILPLVIGGYAISKGDNKDEKVSATLKAGIPILGGIATTFVATAKMMTNMQGLIIGGLTGIVLNALGSKADEKYKEYKENNLFAQKAIAAYKNSISSKSA